MKLKFTKRPLLAVEPPEAGKRLTVYDIEIPKLAMRVTSAGSARSMLSSEPELP